MRHYHLSELSSFLRALRRYGHNKLLAAGGQFETAKSFFVAALMYQRGRLSRPFLHTSFAGLFTVAVLLAPFLPDVYPGAVSDSEQVNWSTQSTASDDVVGVVKGLAVATEVSRKPRDKIITHVVNEGETLTSIAQKYFPEPCLDTLRWANNLQSLNQLNIGDELKIPPVCGVVHQVAAGETIYKIAQKYYPEAGTDLGAAAQPIVDFPFNDFLDDEEFSLLAGQTLIIPGGVVTEKPLWSPSTIKKPQTVTTLARGELSWPVDGNITQYLSYYHSGIDIANRGLPGIAAAAAGRVVHTQPTTLNGYGFYVVIDHGGGLTTTYAHLSEIYVGVGEAVTRGQIIARMGSTGRSTGPHLHFEVRQDGVARNPLNYLR